MAIDYSLYLVTDSSPQILGDKDIVSVVEDAIRGGVTIVQYRDKVSDTAGLIRTAQRLLQVTQRHHVPLIINDRVDVALAVGADGLHIGQEDMDLATARRILGPQAIIGVTASSVSEAVAAAQGGASYLGIGTVYATPTKVDTKSIIGTAGVKEILQHLSDTDIDIPAVAIGSINAANVSRIMYQCSTPQRSLSGVAVVSAVMAAPDPRSAASELYQAIVKVPRTLSPKASENSSVSKLLAQVPRIVKRVVDISPLSHNMTNLVVQNFAANVAICIGASPIMANCGEEAKDLAGLGGSLVVNMGTVTPEGLQNYCQAIRAYNEAGGPVILDPVGGGATSVRREAVKTLLKAGYFDLIKGNENEILTVLGEGSVQQKGVDSGASTSTIEAKAENIRRLAERERNIVLMTGKTDLLSDGTRTIAVENGHRYLGSITGSGCTLGTTASAFLAVEKDDRLLAVLSGILLFEIAAELAGERDDVHGPGTFVPAFLDSLYSLANSDKADKVNWLDRAKIKMI